MNSQNNPYFKFEIITDVFGECFYVKEVLYDNKFKLKIYSGRPIEEIKGANRIIATDELKAFILSTLKLHCKEFNDQLKIGVVSRLRRLLLDNPFKTYDAWVSSKRMNKPRYIRFNDARENPQILTDVLGHRYVLYSAWKTDEGTILPMGVLESQFLDKNRKTSTKYILTHEVAKWIEGTDFNKANKNIPISDRAFCGLCAELGHRPSKVNDDRDAFLVRHLDELLNSMPKAFFLNHPELDVSHKTVADLKYYFDFVLKELQNPQSVLIPALLEHWKLPNAESSKKVDRVFGKNSSNIRRAFLLLKKAKRI